MSTINTESLIIKAELQQLLDDLSYDGDFNEGRNVTNFFTEDCVWVMNKATERGRAGVKKFYDDRAAHLRTVHKHKPPTQRHINTNLRISINAEGLASVDFLCFCVYGAGTDQVPDIFARTTVLDCHADCRRETDGQWRIALLEGVMILERNDGPTPRFVKNMPS